MRRRGRAGAALVMVLALALVLAAMVGMGALFAAVDAASARNAQQRTIADGAAEGALEIAAAAVLRAWSVGGDVIGGVLGPWPAAGLRASATVTVLTPDRVRVDGRATFGGAVAERTVLLGRSSVGPIVLARP